jgi:hypothetical protein
MDVDFVVPMVFEDDALWQKDYQSQMHVLGYRTGENVRYRSWRTEELLVRCVKKFMSFVRTLYIILARESQKRPWMDDKGIKVVYHKDIVPQRFLPCFNSCTIEMFLPYIDGLSEHFIYSNDDMFPVSPLSVSNFFVDGKPVQHLSEKHFPAKPNTFHNKCKRQQEMVAKVFDQSLGDRWLHNGHGLAPLLKSACMEVRKRFDKEVTDGITPYRSETSYNQYLYVLWQHFTGKYVDGRVQSVYLSVKNDVEHILNTICSSCGVVCVNDNECVNNISEYALSVRRALEWILTNKTKD